MLGLRGAVVGAALFLALLPDLDALSCRRGHDMLLEVSLNRPVEAMVDIQCNFRRGGVVRKDDDVASEVSSVALVGLPGVVLAPLARVSYAVVRFGAAHLGY